jgi:ketosteroid isomerase-like protein
MHFRRFKTLVLCLIATNFLLLLSSTHSSSCAVAKMMNAQPALLPGANLASSAEAQQDVDHINAVLKDVLAASNKHAIDAVMSHYAVNYLSGDHLNLQQVKQMIQETWKLYPDIQYDSKLTSLRIAGDWATVETVDTAHATALPDGTLTGPNKAKKGTLDSQSRGLLYLKRAGEHWEIVGDQTLYEQAAILYGDVKNLQLLLSAPDNVVSDQSYTAKLTVKVPANKLVIASIAKDPLVYPQRIPQEKFRSMSDEDTVLERVLQANKDNLNEMITVTVGLTEITQEQDERPNIRLQGVATLVKRVNVMPNVTAVPTQVKGSDLVRKSASGQIDLSRITPTLKAPIRPDKPQDKLQDKPEPAPAL